MITLMASGSVSDYSDNDKSSWQQKVADAAGVDKSLVTISVAAASVLITATIAVPASMTVDDMQTLLSSSLGTADDASTALGVTVEKVPTIAVDSGIAPDSSSDDNVPFIIGIVVARRRRRRRRLGRRRRRQRRREHHRALFALAREDDGNDGGGNDGGEDEEDGQV